MAASAAEYFEVRWRVKDSGEAWAGPRQIAPTSEIVITELDRTQQYEMEVRAVSNCGAKSIWVPSDYTVPGAVPPVPVDTLTAQPLADGVHLGWTSIAIPAAGIEYSVERSADGSTGWAERIRLRATAYTDPETTGATFYYRVRGVNFAGQYGDYSPVVSSAGVNVGDIGTNAANAAADAAAAQTAADAANAALALSSSDNNWSPSEKSTTVVPDYNAIIAEQAGIDAQAVAYGITTEKSTYDTAVAALVNYVNTLITPTDWNDLSGNTTIDGPTARAKFAGVYTSRQALLNAIYTAAKAKADTAKAAADAAQVSADNTRSSAWIINPQFRDGLNVGWTYDNPAGFYVIDNADSPDPNCSVHLGRDGQSSVPNTEARNAGYVGVQVGQTVIVNCGLRAFSCNSGAQAGVRISWRDINGNELSGTVATVTCGPGGTYLRCVSKAVGQAPANAVAAHAEIYFQNHTSGYFTATTANIGILPASIGEVPDGGGRFAVHQVDGNGLAIIDFSQAGHASKNLNNIGDTASYARYAATSWAPETIQNANFLSPADPQGNIPGWASINSVLSIVPAGGPKALQVVLSGTGVGGVFESTAHACKTGDVVSATVTCNLTGQNSGAYPRLQIQCFNAAGTQLTPTGNSDVAVNNAINTLQTANVLATMPAGAVSFRIFVYANASPSFTFLVLDPRISVNDLRVAGSGARIGDQRNLTAVTFGNYGSGWSGLSLTYTSTTTSATISASAATLQAGGASAAYSASSVTVSGSAGTSATYYLYYVDPGMVGGARTLQATTSQITSLSNDGNVLLGVCSVTYPTSGTGGGGGGVSCPAVDAWVIRRDGVARAGDVRVGDELRVVDPLTGAERWGRVTYSQPARADCVRVVTASGTALTCSVTAPLGTNAGQVLAPESVGHALAERRHGISGHSVGVSADLTGKQWVQHITCENAFFLAGDNPDCLLAHHNLKPPIP